MQKLKIRFGSIALFAVIAAVVVVAPVAASADPLSNPSQDEYNPQSQVQGTNTTGSGPQSQVQGTAAAAKPAVAENTSGLNSNVGSLPFTGMDVMVLAIVAAALIGTGVALRRLSAPRAPKA
jgi:hypothetical protein